MISDTFTDTPLPQLASQDTNDSPYTQKILVPFPDDPSNLSLAYIGGKPRAVLRNGTLVSVAGVHEDYGIPKVLEVQQLFNDVTKDVASAGVVLIDFSYVTDGNIKGYIFLGIMHQALSRTPTLLWMMERSQLRATLIIDVGTNILYEISNSYKHLPSNSLVRGISRGANAYNNMDKDALRKALPPMYHDYPFESSAVGGATPFAKTRTNHSADTSCMLLPNGIDMPDYVQGVYSATGISAYSAVNYNNASFISAVLSGHYVQCDHVYKYTQASTAHSYLGLGNWHSFAGLAGANVKTRVVVVSSRGDDTVCGVTTHEYTMYFYFKEELVVTATASAVGVLTEDMEITGIGIHLPKLKGASVYVQRLVKSLTDLSDGIPAHLADSPLQVPMNAEATERSSSPIFFDVDALPSIFNKLPIAT